MTVAADARALVAAARKEIRTIRRYPTLLLSILFWPILLPASYVLMGQAYSGSDPRALEAFAERSGTPLVAGFVFVGFSMYMWLSNLLWGPGTALRTEQVRGSLEAVFLTPASRLVPLFGPPVAHLLPVFANLAVMGLALWLLFGIALSADAILKTLLVVVIAIPAMYGIGTVFASGVIRFGEVAPVVQLVRGTFVLLCGITFPIAMLPTWAHIAAVTMPPTYIVSDMRQVLLGGRSLGDVGADLVFLVACGVILCALGAIVFRSTERAARRSGMLSRY
jgi:ABC-2 type transport system permease protein